MFIVSMLPVHFVLLIVLSLADEIKVLYDVCRLHMTVHSCSTRYRTFLIIFPLVLQRSVIAPTLPNGGRDRPYALSTKVVTN